MNTDEFLDTVILCLKRVKNCNNLHETLKYLQQNHMWDKEYRDKYGYPKESWFNHIKENIDECIKLIEAKDE